MLLTLAAALVPLASLAGQEPRFHLRVVDDLGAPVTGLSLGAGYVQETWTGTSYSGLAGAPRQTDEEGRAVAIPTEPGSDSGAQLEWQLRDHKLQGHAGESIRVAWDGSGKEHTVVIPRVGALEGRVLGPEPMGQIQVFVEGASWFWCQGGHYAGPVGPEAPHTYVTPDPDGRFLVDGLSPGEWEVTVCWGVAASQATVTVRPDEVVAAEFEVAGDGHWLRGRVVDAHGVPSEGASVVCELAPLNLMALMSGDHPTRATSDVDGVFCLGMVAPGWYEIRTRAKGSDPSPKYVSSLDASSHTVHVGPDGAGEITLLARPPWTPRTVRLLSSKETREPMEGLHHLSLQLPEGQVSAEVGKDGSAQIPWPRDDDPVGLPSGARIEARGERLRCWPIPLNDSDWRGLDEMTFVLPGGSIAVESVDGWGEVKRKWRTMTLTRLPEELRLPSPFHLAKPSPTRLQMQSRSGPSPDQPFTFIGLEHGSYQITVQGDKPSEARVAQVTLRPGERVKVKVERVPGVLPSYVLGPEERIPVDPESVMVARDGAPCGGSYLLGREHHVLARAERWAAAGTFTPVEEGSSEVVLYEVQTGDLDLLLTFEGQPMPTAVSLVHPQGHIFESRPWRPLFFGEPEDPVGHHAFRGLPAGTYRVWARGGWVGEVNVLANDLTEATIRLDAEGRKGR